MGSFIKEGMSFNRPPLFDGTNYDYWSSRMKCHVQAIDFTLWRIIVDGPLIPMRIKVTKPGDAAASDSKTQATGKAEEIPVEDIYTIDLSDLRKSELDKISLNAKAMNILHLALCEEEYGRVKGCQTAKEIWDCLEATHVGTSQVKDTKIRVLTSEYEAFKMKEGETVAAMHQRLNLIVNNLRALGKTYSTKDLNGKILASLTGEFFPKTCAITEAKDIGSLPTEDLIGSLLAFEVVLGAKKSQDKEAVKEKKSLALAAAKSSKKAVESEEESDEEDMVMLAKKFKKFMRFNKFKKRDFSKKSKGDSQEQEDEQPRCFECNKPGHMRANCPKLKNKHSKKKAMKATWDDTETESESEKEEEVANVVGLTADYTPDDTWDNLSSDSDDEVIASKLACLMANDATKVTNSNYSFSDSDDSCDDNSCHDLSEAFEVLYVKHENLLIKTKSLKKNNKSMTTQIKTLENEVARLKNELQNAKPFNLEFCELRKIFEKIKVENENLKESLKRFEVGENTLTKILHSQHEYVDRRGIGYKGSSSSSNSKRDMIFVAASSSKTRTSFSCTYCQKGNHTSLRCPIRKLCELGTLIPACKKPRWVVKTNPLRTNPHGPNKIWVPRTSV